MHRQKMKRTKGNTALTMLLTVFSLLATSYLFTACSSDEAGTPSSPANTDSEIRFDVGVWNMMDGTRTTFYDTGEQNSGSFTCAAFSANSITPYFDYTTVNWVTNAWAFSDGKHYWPETGYLDFFAYMPVGGAGYINSISYTTVRNPQFVCTDLPMAYDGSNASAGQGSALEEFVLALVTDQSKAGQGASGVSLYFRHPFARINLQLAANHPDITINTITFKSLKNNGTCSFDGTTSTWTPSGNATNFVVTLNQAYSYKTEAQDIAVPFIMIPQDFAGEIEVNASWNDWGDSPVAHTLTKTISAVTWAPGTSYTYTFTITPEDLTVDTANYTEQW